MARNDDDRIKLYERIDIIQDALVTAWGSEDLRLRSFSEVQLRALEGFGT